MCRPVLLVALLFLMGALLCSAQHWSHGWYPGGKRDTTEISGEIKVCESGECSYLRPQHRGVLRNIFLDALTRELQRRK